MTTATLSGGGGWVGNNNNNNNNHRAGHQPHIVYDQPATASHPYAIRNPEVSQAFYGELHGKPNYFVLCSPGPFHLNVQIATPLIPNASEDWVVHIRSPQGYLVKTLNGSKYGRWTLFHESFANDTYRQGPSYDNARAPAGDYLIEVSNPGTQNLGKYVLAVGVLEQFSPDDIARAIQTVDRLKTEYWQPGPTRWASPTLLGRGGPVLPRTHDTLHANKAVNGLLAGQSAATAGPLVVLPPGAFAPGAPVIATVAQPATAVLATNTAPFPWGAFFFTLLVILTLVGLAWYYFFATKQNFYHSAVTGDDSYYWDHLHHPKTPTTLHLMPDESI